MSFYFVSHHHNVETCLAQNPAMAAKLLQHIRLSNDTRCGINLLSDAVIDGEATFVLILEAENEQSIQEFTLPFSTAGSSEIYPVNQCKAVIDHKEW
jgi:hypothetical protein